MSILDDYREAKKHLLESAPPRLEIWVMEIMPYLDERGEPVIVKINIKELEKASSVAIPAKFETITNADELIMMHPTTFLMLQNNSDFREMTSGMFAVPVFDDEYRREHFANGRKEQP